MNKLKHARVVLRIVNLTMIVTLFALTASVSHKVAATALEPARHGGYHDCEKNRAALRRLQRQRPNKRLTREQIFNRIKRTCDAMRSQNCPNIPLICATD